MIGRCVLSLIVAASLTGCALRVSDQNGRVTTVGLVWSTHEAPSQPLEEKKHTRLVFGPQRVPDPPRWIEMRAAGFIFENTMNNRGLTLGYKDSLWVFPVAEGVTTTEGEPGEPATVVVSTLSSTEIPAPTPKPKQP